MLSAQSDARTIVQPEPSALRLLRRDFQPLTLPETFHPLVVDVPASIAQQSCDPPIAIPTILPSQFDHVLDKPFLIGTTSGDATLGGTVLTKHATSLAFGNAQRATHLIDALPAT